MAYMGQLKRQARKPGYMIGEPEPMAPVTANEALTQAVAPYEQQSPHDPEARQHAQQVWKETQLARKDAVKAKNKQAAVFIAARRNYQSKGMNLGDATLAAMRDAGMEQTATSGLAKYVRSVREAGIDNKTASALVRDYQQNEFRTAAAEKTREFAGADREDKQAAQAEQLGKAQAFAGEQNQARITASGQENQARIAAADARAKADREAADAREARRYGLQVEQLQLMKDKEANDVAQAASEAERETVKQSYDDERFYLEQAQRATSTTARPEADSTGAAQARRLFMEAMDKVDALRKERPAPVPQDRAKLVKGQTYRSPSGQLGKWNGTEFEAI